MKASTEIRSQGIQADKTLHALIRVTACNGTYNS
jgi:hypothetical protein